MFELTAWQSLLARNSLILNEEWALSCIIKKRDWLIFCTIQVASTIKQNIALIKEWVQGCIIKNHINRAGNQIRITHNKLNSLSKVNINRFIVINSIRQVSYLIFSLNTFSSQFLYTAYHYIIIYFLFHSYLSIVFKMKLLLLFCLAIIPLLNGM